MLNKTMRYLKSKREGIASFVLSAVIMAVVLQFSGVLFAAKYSLLRGDLLEEYIPAIRNLCRDILYRENIYFSWNTELGINTSLFNSFFAFSPFNLIYLLFYNADLNRVTAFLIIVRTGLAAFCFQKFISEVHRVEGLFSILFSILYSLCAFQISFNTLNIMWLDAMFVLPLIFLYVNRLITTGKAIGLCVWYAYIFVSQFYMGYMIGIVSFCYFIISLFLQDDMMGFRQKASVFKKYVLAVVIAVGMSAFVWLPTLFFIIGNTGLGESVHLPLNTSIISVYCSLFWGQHNWMNSDKPAIYCGVLILLMVPGAFFYSNIRRQDKLTYLTLITILFFACLCDPLYMFMHGFDNPDGWLFRFSYILSFLLCTVSAIAISKYERRDIVITIIVLIGNIILLILAGIFDKTALHGLITPNVQIVSNITFMILWLFLIWRYRMGNPADKRIWGLMMLALASVELLSSAFLQRANIAGRSAEMYNVWFSSGKELSDAESLDKRYRVSSMYEMTSNYGSLWGYPSASYFTSAENSAVRHSLGQLGLYNSPRMMLDYGLTPVTKMLLGIKYDTYNGLERVLHSNEESIKYEARVEENNKALTLGYMVHGDLEDYDFYGENAFENNNYLIAVMTGNKMLRPFEPVPYEGISFIDRGVSIERTEDGYHLSVSDRMESNKLRILIEDSDYEQVYSYFYNSVPGKRSDTDYFLLEGGYENEIEKNGDLNVPYIKPLKRSDDGYELSISSSGSVEDGRFEDMFFYKISDKAFSDAFSELSSNQISIEEKTDKYVKAHISTDGEKKILFTTIPYDESWKARINGKPTRIYPIMNGAFVSFFLPEAGEYNIELNYNAIGSNAGALISAISFLILLIILIIERRNLRNIKIKQEIL